MTELNARRAKGGSVLGNPSPGRLRSKFSPPLCRSPAPLAGARSRRGAAAPAR
jgi:hypothetical protein